MSCLHQDLLLLRGLLDLIALTHSQADLTEQRAGKNQDQITNSGFGSCMAILIWQITDQSETSDMPTSAFISSSSSSTVSGVSTPTRCLSLSHRTFRGGRRAF